MGKPCPLKVEPTTLPSPTTHWLSVGSLRSSGRTLKKLRKCGQREILTGRLMSALQYSVRVPWRLSAARCPSNHRGAGGTREGHQRTSEHTCKVRSGDGGSGGDSQRADEGSRGRGAHPGDSAHSSPGRCGMILFSGLMSPASIGNISFKPF